MQKIDDAQDSGDRVDLYCFTAGLYVGQSAAVSIR
jgi:hypothetical protein